MPKSTITIDMVADAVIELYMATGRDSDVPTIATRLGCAVSTVRKRIDEVRGAIPGCQLYAGSRQTYSKSYPGMEHGAVAVSEYGPRRETLRRMLNDARYGTGGAT